MNELFAKLILITAKQPTITDRLRYVGTCMIHFAPIAFVLDLINWWFTENKQFGTFMSIALLINLIVGAVYHLKNKTFSPKDFILKNIEMAGVIVLVYIMLEMLRYTAGANLAGEIFKITIQITTLLYPTSKVLKNIFIITDGKYPPEFLMNKLYNFEKNGDLSEFFKSKKEE
jgi:hypothetical protein